MRKKVVGTILISMLILSACTSNKTKQINTDIDSSTEEASYDTISVSESSIQEIQEEAESTESSETSDLAELDTSRIIEDQSFDIKLNEWGNVRFISCSPDKNISPSADVTFYLMDGENVIYKFPSVYENDIREWDLFEGVSFVAFRDLNRDEKDEVIVGVLFITGVGPQGMIPRTEVRIFEDKGDSFEYSKDMSEYISGVMPDDGTIQDVYYGLKWYELESLDAASLYKDIQKVDNAKNVEGDWQATKCHSACAGGFYIKNQTDEGFSFEGCFAYFSHSGEIIGNAHWVSPTMAICNQDDIEDTMDDGYMVFLFDGDLMYVSADYGLGCMGMNVSPKNAYTRGEPEYTNADKVDSTYTEDELSEIHELLGDDLYDDPFLFGTSEGCIDSSTRVMEDGNNCKYVECFIPTINESYTAIITQDGKIYIKISVYDNEYLYTNDNEWDSDELPETY